MSQKNESPGSRAGQPGQKAHFEAIKTQVHTTTPPQSSAIQRSRILKYLQQGHRLTTLHARESLGIPHPAGRVQELRREGWNIVTHRRLDTDVTGRQHPVAEYVLLNG